MALVDLMELSLSKNTKKTRGVYINGADTDDAEIYGNKRGIQGLYSFLSFRGFL